jgi:hypothetical protein
MDISKVILMDEVKGGGRLLGLHHLTLTSLEAGKRTQVEAKHEQNISRHSLSHPTRPALFRQWLTQICQFPALST